MWKKYLKEMEDSDDEDMSLSQVEITAEQKFSKLVSENKLTDNDFMTAAHSHFLWKYLKGNSNFIYSLAKKPSDYKGIVDPELVGATEPGRFPASIYLPKKYEKLDYKVKLWVAILNSDPLCISAIPKELFEKHRDCFTEQFASQYVSIVGRKSVNASIFQNKEIMYYIECPELYENIIRVINPKDVEVEHLLKSCQDTSRPYKMLLISIGCGPKNESDDECEFAHLQEKLTDAHIDGYLNECKNSIFDASIIPRKFRTEERLVRAFETCSYVLFPEGEEYSQEFWNKYALMKGASFEKIPAKYLTADIYLAQVKIRPAAILGVPNEFKTQEMCKIALENCDIYKAVKDIIK